MSSSAAQRALNIYEIAELILRNAACGLPLKDSLLLQRTCSTWHSIIRRWLLLGKAPLDKPVKRRHCPTPGKDMGQSQTINISDMVWVYNPILQDVEGLFIRNNDLSNCYCDGKASCLDLYLAVSGVKVDVYWDPHNDGEDPRIRECYKTVRNVIEAAVRQLQRTPELGTIQSAAIPFVLLPWNMLNREGDQTVESYIWIKLLWDKADRQEDGTYRYRWRTLEQLTLRESSRRVIL